MPLAHIRTLLLTLVVIIAVVAEWCYTRTMPLPTLAVTSEEKDLGHSGKRHLQHFKLYANTLGEIGLAVSFPDPMPAKKMPIVMVLGGLATGEDNIRNITNPGDNVIVGYDWPMPVKPPGFPDFILNGRSLYNQAIVAPSQVGAAMDWLAAQPWADGSRLSILGYSLGALAVPAAEEATQLTGHVVRWTIIAYGGTPFGDVFAADKHIQPDWMRMALAPVIDIVLHPLQPDLHLPNLTGHFLILEGKNDELIPEKARARLRAAVPEPKTVIAFEGDHMGVGPDKTALLQKVIETSRAWLIKMGAVNPL